MIQQWVGEIKGDDFNATVQIIYDNESKSLVSNWSGTLVSDNHLKTMDVLETTLGKIMLTSVKLENDYYVASFIGIGSFQPG